ncbi:MAG TPA: MarR family winged helix-turn-helix transcriptional regulator [Solirubrobacteraceae bacterium]|jgi:DNA-binding MarR family transcriptional regulator|nr:MarR family winged helix-turn-helix transcriptional regulator [Solirubrobacteraceae bacterium]
MAQPQLSGDANSDEVRIVHAVTLAAALAHAAYHPQARWVDRVRTGLQALLEFADEEHELARLCVQRALVGRAVHPCLDRALDRLVQVIDQGRGASAASKQPPSLTAQSLLGGALGLVHARLTANDGGSLVALRNPLMATIVLPYLGHGAARREQFRREPTRPAVQPNGKRFALGIRLTHRTARVLAVLAAQSGLRNSQVAERAGIKDQGQVSKLLARLNRLGLIQNTGAGHTRGRANAWRLTGEGRELLREIERLSAYVAA